MIKYLILLLSTGLITGAPAAWSSPSVTDNVITWPEDGWYQVQSANGAITFCNGGQSCEVAPGEYLVVNHTTGERFTGIQVLGGSDANANSNGITVEGNVISWPDDGWYQVQSNNGETTYCNGGPLCVVEAGIYLVINHSTGVRTNNIIVTNTNMSADNRIQVSGNVISWPDNGWYEVQGSSGSPIYCQGGRSCTLVESGSYLVVNHTTGERFPNIQVVEGAPAPDDINIEAVVREFYSLLNLTPYRLVRDFATDILQLVKSRELTYIKSDGGYREELHPDLSNLSLGIIDPSFLEYRFDCPDGGYLYTGSSARDLMFFVNCSSDTTTLTGAMDLQEQSPLPVSVTFLGVNYQDELGNFEARTLDYTSTSNSNSNLPHRTFALVLGLRANYPDLPTQINKGLELIADRPFNEVTEQNDLSSVLVNSYTFLSSAVPAVAVSYHAPPANLMPHSPANEPEEAFMATDFDGRIFRLGGITVSIGEGKGSRNLVLNFSASDEDTLQVDDYAPGGAMTSHRLPRDTALSSEVLSAQAYNPIKQGLEFILSDEFLP